MPNIIQILRSLTALARPAAGSRQPGELFWNDPDKVLGIIDEAQNPIDLVGVGTTKAYVEKSGDTMTGFLTIDFTGESSPSYAIIKADAGQARGVRANTDGGANANLIQVGVAGNCEVGSASFTSRLLGGGDWDIQGSFNVLNGQLIIDTTGLGVGNPTQLTMLAPSGDGGAFSFETGGTKRNAISAVGANDALRLGGENWASQTMLGPWRSAQKIICNDVTTAAPAAGGYITRAMGDERYIQTEPVAGDSQKIIAGGTADIALTLKGNAAATANLQNWEDSNGVILSSIGADGRINIRQNNTDDNVVIGNNNGGGATFERSTYGQVRINTAAMSIQIDDPTGTITNVFRIKSVNQAAAEGDVQNRNNSYGAWSDERLKENIVDLPPQLTDMMALRPVHYNLKDAPGQTHAGLIAQEVEAVKPGLVSTDSEEEGGLKSIKYSVLVPLMLKAMQEQQATIKGLETRLAAVEVGTSGRHDHGNHGNKH